MFGWSAGGAGDLNHDGIGDIFISDSAASPSGRSSAGQVHVIFGQTDFAATFDLAALNGTNGFTVNGKTAGDQLGWPAGPAGDVNGDGVDDLLMSATYQYAPDGRKSVGGAYVLFGKNGAFPATFELSTVNGSNGFVMYGVSASDFAKSPGAAGDVNGDGYDDVILTSYYPDPNGITNAGQTYIVYGRPSFAASLELASLLAANGGDGSAGYALNGFVAAPTSTITYVAEIGDINDDGFADVRIGCVEVDSNGLTDNGQVYIVYGKPSPARTKFYVVNDAAQDQTYEYYANGGSRESYNLNSANTAPRGAASTIAGEKVWVVDANRKVYVYNTGGGLVGSWTAGTLASNATVEGIATNGTDVWIVDAKSDKVYKYSGAATRTIRNPVRVQQLFLEQQQHESQRHRDRRCIAVGGQRQYHRQGVQVLGGGIAQGKLDDQCGRRESDRDYAGSRECQQSVDCRQRHRSRLSVRCCRHPHIGIADGVPELCSRRRQHQPAGHRRSARSEQPAGDRDTGSLRPRLRRSSPA